MRLPWNGRVIARLAVAIPPPSAAAAVRGASRSTKPIRAQIDPSTLRPGSGAVAHCPQHYEFVREKSNNGRADVDALFFPSQHSSSSSSQQQLEAFLEVYVYGNPTIVVNLNRDANETVDKTLLRLERSLYKKLNQQQQQQQQQSNTKKAKKTSPSSSSSVDDDTSSLSKLWQIDPAASSNYDVGQEVDVSAMTLVQLCNEARYTHFSVEICAGLKFLVESCPPTIASVQTFDDFSSYLFPGVPIVIHTTLLYATNVTVEWFVDSKLCCQGEYFMPSESDVGKKVAVLLTPWRSLDGGGERRVNGIEEAYRFERLVQARPENIILQLRPQWVKQRSSSAETTDEQHLLRVLSYNILADQNAFQANQRPFYPYVSKEVLSKARRMPLLVHEILAYQADILCLQEVDESVFYSLFQPVLAEFGYDGYFSCKTWSREGPATFWLRNQFETGNDLDRKTFRLGDLVPATTSPHDDDDDDPLVLLLNKKADLRHILSSRLGHVAQYVTLTNKKSGKHLTVVNTHLFFHPIASHIRLIQMYLLAQKISNELSHNKNASLIISGDLNSSLQKPTGKLLVDRSVAANDANLKDDLNRFSYEDVVSATAASDNDGLDFPSLSLPSTFPTMQSALSTVPSFTHYVEGFYGTLDHILTSQDLVSVQSAPMPAVRDVAKETAMPSTNLPSDHVSLVCDLRFR